MTGKLYRNIALYHVFYRFIAMFYSEVGLLHKIDYCYHCIGYDEERQGSNKFKK